MNEETTSKSNLINTLIEAKEFLLKHKIEDWYEVIVKTIEYFENDDFSRLKNVYLVFSPTCAWDDLTASIKNDPTDRGINIGNKVFTAIKEFAEYKNIDLYEK